MKKMTKFLTLLLVVTTLFSSFKSNERTVLEDPGTEFELLVQYLETQGNFINSELAPALVMAPEIKENLKNKKYLVLDIRSGDWFDYGHIKNAVNVKGPELLNYFKNEIDPTAYDKISVVCYTGQSAAYYTSLLRLYGFDNVYSLKWGMSSWADEFAGSWKKNAVDTFADQMETSVNPMPEKGAYPTLNTGKTDPAEILKTRIEAAFAKPYKEYITKAVDVMENPSDFFVAHYVNEEQYNFGHIPGAVQFVPRKSLASTGNLSALPADKKILMHCLSGQSAAYTVAYLNVLGYDVYNLAYGSNSIMNTTLTVKSWSGFNADEIKNYPVVE